MKNFIEGAIYKLKQATSVCVNGEEYVVSAVTGDYYIGDCFPCDQYGNVADGYESPVPFEAEDLDEVVGMKQLI